VTQRARRIQPRPCESMSLGVERRDGGYLPITSLATPAERVTIPAVVLKRLSSMRILQRTGKAY
jgi:hypothetical protein